jgi:hypothetical protein
LFVLDKKIRSHGIVHMRPEITFLYSVASSISSTRIREITHSESIQKIRPFPVIIARTCYQTTCLEALITQFVAVTARYTFTTVSHALDACPLYSTLVTFGHRLGLHQPRAQYT